MGKLIRNGIEYGGGNGTDIFKVTQSEYDALKQAGALVHNALYVITDAENLNCTADDIEYSTGVSVADGLDSKADTSTTYTKTQVDALLEKTIYQHSFSGNQTLDSIQTWCKTADKGTYWFNAYMTTPYQGWTMGIITNKHAATSHTQILVVFNSAIVTSFTSTLTDTTPTWTTKSIILS